MKSSIYLCLFLFVVACSPEIKSPQIKSIVCEVYESDGTIPVDTSLAPKLSYMETYYPNGFKKNRITPHDTIDYCYLDSLLVIEDYQHYQLLTYYRGNKLELKAQFYSSPSNVQNFLHLGDGEIEYTYDSDELLFRKVQTRNSMEGEDSISFRTDTYYREAAPYSVTTITDVLTKIGKEFKLKYRTSREEYSWNEDSPSITDKRYEAAYNNKGQMISFGDTIYTYHGNGKLKQVQYGDKAREYDEIGNLTSELKYDDGEFKFKYAYQYDQYNNWTRKETFREGMLIKVEKRTLEYYTTQEPFQLKKADKKLVDTIYSKTREYIDRCQANMGKLEAYHKAVEEGEYDDDFTLAEAASIDDFTPRLWSILSKMKFDYNHDGVDDYVIAYNTPVKAEDEGEQRVLAMFEKNSNGKWELKQSFTNVIISYGSKWGMMPPTLYGVDLKDECVVVSDGLELGRGYSKERYYQYLKEGAYNVPSDGWYMVMEDYTSHDGPEAFYHTVTDYKKGTRVSVNEYDYEDPKESPIGKNGKEEKKEKLTEIPPRMGGVD